MTFEWGEYRGTHRAREAISMMCENEGIDTSGAK